eukprot:9180511-Ditylum_brightwellii.AAC.1
MMKASLIKNSQHQSSNLGHSIVALQLTIPDAGCGIFIDVTICDGSIFAFFPGQVWPKELLLQPTASSEAIFDQDYNFHLSLQYDDILIDSRRAPYT